MPICYEKKKIFYRKVFRSPRVTTIPQFLLLSIQKNIGNIDFMNDKKKKTKLWTEVNRSELKFGQKLKKYWKKKGECIRRMQVLWRKNCTIKINDYLLHVNYNFCLGFGECKRSRQDWTKGMRKGSLPVVRMLWILVSLLWIRYRLRSI